MKGGVESESEVLGTGSQRALKATVGSWVFYCVMNGQFPAGIPILNPQNVTGSEGRTKGEEASKNCGYGILCTPCLSWPLPVQNLGHCKKSK